MARHRRTRLNPDLFPFLNIVVCVIGVIAFLITVLATVGTEQGDAAKAYADVSASVAEKRATAAHLADLLKQDAALVESIRRLAELIQRDTKAADEVQKLEAEVSALRTKLAKVRARSTELAGLSDLFSRQQKVSTDLAALDAELNRLKVKTDEARKSTAPGGSSPGAESVRVVFPATGNKGLTPVFVECAATGLTVYPENATIAKAQIARSAAYRALLDRVKADDKLTLNFLIRPDGVETFDQAREIARDRAVKYGYVPAPGSGRITISDESSKKP